MKRMFYVFAAFAAIIVLVWACSSERDERIGKVSLAEVGMCGDDIIDEGEDCDGLELGGNDCTTVPGNFCGGILSCTGECTFDTTSCTACECGDGELGGTEECDDANTDPCDGCSATCTLEWCGNGVPECNEECDDGNADNTDACVANCRDATCRDGYVWSGIEECDDGNTDNNDGCRNDCVAEYCGDGKKQPYLGEQCDNGGLCDAGPNFGLYCTAVYHCPGGLCEVQDGDGCDLDCQFECGNGVIDAGETCDDGNRIPNDGCDANCQEELQ